MQLYVMRHGETSWNTERKIQGRTDVELTENGIKMAEASAEGMKDIKFDYIYSSPLTRARTTAEIICKNRDNRILIDDRLMEVCFGEWEGKDIRERQDMLEAFFDDPVNYVATGGAETYEEILERAKGFIEDIAYPLAKKEPQCKVLVLGHAAINRALYAILMKTELKDFWAPPHRKNCDVDIFEIGETGEVNVIEEAKNYM